MAQDDSDVLRFPNPESGLQVLSLKLRSSESGLLGFKSRLQGSESVLPGFESGLQDFELRSLKLSPPLAKSSKPSFKSPKPNHRISKWIPTRDPVGDPPCGTRFLQDSARNVVGLPSFETWLLAVPLPRPAIQANFHDIP